MSAADALPGGESAFGASLGNLEFGIGGSILFVLYSSCLTLCIPTSPLEFVAITAYGWKSFPICIAAKYFILLVVVPLVLSGRCFLSQYLLQMVTQTIDTSKLLQFFQDEVRAYPARTALLIRMLTIPVSIQNYFLCFVGCPLKYSLLALTIGSIPMTAIHFYALITVSSLVSEVESGHANVDFIVTLSKLLGLMGLSVIPGFFVRRYHMYQSTASTTEYASAIPTTLGALELSSHNATDRQTTNGVAEEVELV